MASGSEKELANQQNEMAISFEKLSSEVKKIAADTNYQKYEIEAIAIELEQNWKKERDRLEEKINQHGDALRHLEARIAALEANSHGSILPKEKFEPFPDIQQTIPSEGVHEDKKNALEISQSRLITFTGPFTEQTISTVQLRNISSYLAVHFKVKTTRPKHVGVRPNYGMILPGEDRRVELHLEPKVEVEQSDLKFKIQYCVAPSEQEKTDEIWKTIPASEIMHTKIRAEFVMN